MKSHKTVATCAVLGLAGFVTVVLVAGFYVDKKTEGQRVLTSFSSSPVSRDDWNSLKSWEKDEIVLEKIHYVRDERTGEYFAYVGIPDQPGFSITRVEPSEKTRGLVCQRPLSAGSY